MSRFKATPFFRWYDLWIGIYIDRDNKTVYICPLPTLGLKVERGEFVRKHFTCNACGYEWHEKVPPHEDSLHCRKCFLFQAMTPEALEEYQSWLDSEGYQLMEASE